MEFLMAIRHLRLDSVLSADKEEVLVTDRTISRDCLNTHCGNSKVATHFAVRSLISRSLKTDAEKQVFFSTKSSVAGWDRVAFFHRAETQGAKLLLSRKVLSARFSLVKILPSLSARSWNYLPHFWTKWEYPCTKSPSGCTLWTIFHPNTSLLRTTCKVRRSHYHALC